MISFSSAAAWCDNTNGQIILQSVLWKLCKSCGWNSKTFCKWQWWVQYNNSNIVWSRSTRVNMTSAPQKTCSGSILTYWSALISVCLSDHVVFLCAVVKVPPPHRVEVHRINVSWSMVSPERFKKHEYEVQYRSAAQSWKVSISTSLISASTKKFIFPIAYTWFLKRWLLSRSSTQNTHTHNMQNITHLLQLNAHNQQMLSSYTRMTNIQESVNECVFLSGTVFQNSWAVSAECLMWRKVFSVLQKKKKCCFTVANW